MILTHGANSLSRDDENYILDNFVALYNGVTDSGYAINDGSFGQLLWDANGPIQAPNGQGTPYYARENFSGNNGGVQAIYDGLKSVFSDNNTFTIDFWFYWTNPSSLENPYIFSTYNNDRSVAGFYIIQNRGTEFVFRRSNDISVQWNLYTNMWTHVAVVCNRINIKLYINGVKVQDGTYDQNRATNDQNTLRFRFVGSAGGIRIAQFALRDYAVWTSDFTPPTLLYKQI